MNTAEDRMPPFDSTTVNVGGTNKHCPAVVALRVTVFIYFSSNVTHDINLSAAKFTRVSMTVLGTHDNDTVFIFQKEPIYA